MSVDGGPMCTPTGAGEGVLSVPQNNALRDAVGDVENCWACIHPFDLPLTGLILSSGEMEGLDKVRHLFNLAKKNLGMIPLAYQMSRIIIAECQGRKHEQDGVDFRPFSVDLVLHHFRCHSADPELLKKKHIEGLDLLVTKLGDELYTSPGGGSMVAVNDKKAMLKLRANAMLLQYSQAASK